jgi:hypothetical protein
MRRPWNDAGIQPGSGGLCARQGSPAISALDVGCTHRPGRPHINVACVQKMVSRERASVFGGLARCCQRGVAVRLAWPRTALGGTPPRDGPACPGPRKAHGRKPRVSMTGLRPATVERINTLLHAQPRKVQSRASPASWRANARSPGSVPRSRATSTPAAAVRAAAAGLGRAGSRVVPSEGIGARSAASIEREPADERPCAASPVRGEGRR